MRAAKDAESADTRASLQAKMTNLHTLQYQRVAYYTAQQKSSIGERAAFDSGMKNPYLENRNQMTRLAARISSPWLTRYGSQCPTRILLRLIAGWKARKKQCYELPSAMLATEMCLNFTCLVYCICTILQHNKILWSHPGSSVCHGKYARLGKFFLWPVYSQIIIVQRFQLQ